MQCAYFSAGLCRSCTHLEVPYATQLRAKQQRVTDALSQYAPEWLAPQASAEAYFRNKAKMVVGGRTGRVTLGILDRQQHGVDLTGCELHERPLLNALPRLSSWINEVGLTPYSVPTKQGELKHVLLTVSPDAELAVRFVLRSEAQLGRIRRGLEALYEAVPGIRVVSANLQPEHKAVLEGDVEVSLSDADRLPMRLGEVTLQLGYRSFFQTNTEVTRALYARASEWITRAQPRTVWDLYCGVGGFALHAAAAARLGNRVPESSLHRPSPDSDTVRSDGPSFDRRSVQHQPAGDQIADSRDLDIVGVEVSEDAIVGAQLAAKEAGVAARFVAGDATEMAQRGERLADVVVVNPPRRGITSLAPWLDASGVERVIYSSCNPVTLQRDIAAMPGLQPVRAQLFDMFPHTEHAEVLVELVRR